MLIKNPPKKRIPYEIFNIGSSRPETLRNYLSKLENLLGKKAKIKKLKLQKGDVLKTHASISKLKNKTKFKVKFDISSGISKFVDWYMSYYENSSKPSHEEWIPVEFSLRWQA